MASDRFEFILIEIPRNITLSLVKDVKNSIKSISAKDAVIINEVLELDLSEVEVNEVDEEDLFNIGEESLRAKHAVHGFLDEAVNLILVPRINAESRISAPIHDKTFAYLNVEGKLFAVSGDQTSYYSSRVSSSYKYILALSLSNILKDYQ